jgi:hypothetical protein
MPDDDNERQYRVINQMTTMHSALRDRYARRAMCLSLALIASSVALNAFVFAPDSSVGALFGVTAERAKNGIGVASVALLMLSIIELRVDWDDKSRSHADAVKRLSGLKAHYREVDAMRENAERIQKQRELADEYARTMDELPAIPEWDFERLKAYHVYKLALSHAVSENPGAPLWLLRLRVRYRGYHGALTTKDRAK